jgi:hypothetical protein
MGRKGKTLLSLSLSLSLGVQLFGVLRDVHLGQPEEMTERNSQFLGYYESFPPNLISIIY